MSASEARTGAESMLWDEMSEAINRLRKAIADVQRPRPVQVKIGWPKPAWAHIYYVSFHDPANSRGPTEGFYPVFLMSVDQRLCWLSVCLAAASEDISGRGGWSNLRGNRLKQRAELLSSALKERDDWRKGPIKLGPDGTFLHQERGASRSTGRAYECGAIISKSFDPHNPPDDLSNWLTTAFDFYDEVLNSESTYIESSILPILENEWNEQINASVVGRRAEQFFIEKWCIDHPELGPPIDKTNSTGLGYDVMFPQVGIYIEIKGFRGQIGDVRLTKKEWERAKEKGDKFVLCLISELDSNREPQVAMITNPYNKLLNWASKTTRIQITYSIASRKLKEVVDH